MSNVTVFCCCIYCGKVISNKNVANHCGSKSCLHYSKTGRDLHASPNYKFCPYCELDVSGLLAHEKANHTRWCKSNPKRSQYIETLNEVRSRMLDQEIKESTVEKRRIGISKAHREGKYINAWEKGLETRIKNGNLKHTPQAIENCRKAAQNSNHQRKCKKSHPYVDKRGRMFTFDSSWEDALADRLDDLDIRWIRPDPVYWYDSFGKRRSYFPDFYLIDFDIYIDPKNEFVRKKQEEKLENVSTFLNLIILNSKRLCEEFSL